jgi:hypothetical protein
MSCVFFLLIPHWILSSRIRSPALPVWARPATGLGEPRGQPGSGRRGRTPRRRPGRTPPPAWASSARSGSGRRGELRVAGLGELRPAGLGKLRRRPAPRLSSAPTAVSFAPGQVPSLVRAATASSSLAPVSRHPWRKKEARERDNNETGERRKRKTGAERPRPSNSEGRTNPHLEGIFPRERIGSAPLPRLSNQTHG